MNVREHRRAAVNDQSSVKRLTAEERAAWRKQNLADLAEAMALPFGEKVQILQDLEEMSLALGYTRDPATGRLTKNGPAEDKSAAWKG